MKKLPVFVSMALLVIIVKLLLAILILVKILVIVEKSHKDKAKEQFERFRRKNLIYLKK